MSYEDDAVQPLPQLTNSGWMYWPKTRAVIAIVAILQFIISVPIGLALFGMFILGVMALLISKSPNNRQFVYQWFEQLYADRKEKRRALKRGPYRTKELREVIYAGEDGDVMEPLRGAVEPGFIPLDGGKSGFLTEVRTPATNEHTLYLMSDGYGAAGSGDPDDLRAANQMVVEALKEVGSEYGPGLAATLIFARVPTNLNEALAFIERRLAETDSELGQRLADNIAEAMANQSDMNGDVFLGIAIRAPRPKSWNKAKTPASIQTNEILQAPAYKLSEVLLSRMKSMGMDRPRRPTPFEAITFIHGGLDPSTIEQLYLDSFADTKRMESGELEFFEQSLLMRRGILPPDWQPEHTHLRIGDTNCRMFFVPDYPDAFVEAGLMRHLVRAPEDIWYGIAFSYETQNIGTERRRINLRRREGDSRRYQRSRYGKSSSVADEDRELIERQQERIQYYSRGGVIKLNTLAWVNSGGLQGMNASEERLAQIFRDVNLPLNRVTGRSIQVAVRLMAFGIKSEKV
jgi:hypothetical protein